LATLILAFGTTILSVQSQADDFDTIKAAAEKEGKIVVWHNTPKQNTTDALAAAFNKRFGMNIEVERVSVPGGSISSRLMTEKRGGKFTVDVFIATDRHLPLMVKNGLVEKVDWVKTFGGPGKIDAALLENAADHIIPEFVGYGLEFRHSVFGIAYNTKILSEDEIPTTWEGLTDPKWKNKMVVDAGLSPLARLAPVIGHDAVLDLARKMVANRPIYSDGQPSSAKKIVSGEAPLGILTLSSALDERHKGAPIDLAFPEPQAIISQQVLYVTKGGPHPNLAKLWAAWLASEGMNNPDMVKAGILRAWPGSPGEFGEYYSKHHLQVRRAMSIKELEQANSIRKDLDAIASGRGR
jgi:iron(III) transport system substrate-binding protein